ncbi:MAG: cupin domain-containing protein [Holophagaceae bacterium]|nr:cupin domain-containing protein [Holophagaceae bacterium]
MNPLLTCEEVLRIIPEYQEHLLAPSLRLRFSLHLRMCKPCRAMLESLQAIPNIFQRAVSDEAPAPSSEARGALEAVLARLQAGGRLTAKDRNSQIHRCSSHPMPAFVEKAIADGSADGPMRLMAMAYGAIQAQEGRPVAEPFLPESVLEELPPLEKWKWTKTLLNGCSSAFLSKDPRTGATLHMILLPPGQRFPDHRHQGEEHVLLLSGQAEDTLCYGIAGDWFHQASGSDHRELQGRGTDVCWTLTRLESPGVRLSGWRGAVQSFAERMS